MSAPVKKRPPRPRLAGGPLAMMGQDAGLLTAQARADALGISRSHLLHIERGDCMPSPAIMDAMSEVYHKPVTFIQRAADESVVRLAERKIAQVKGFR